MCREVADEVNPGVEPSPTGRAHVAGGLIRPIPIALGKSQEISKNSKESVQVVLDLSQKCPK